MIKLFRPPPVAAPLLIGRLCIEVLGPIDEVDSQIEWPLIRGCSLERVALGWGFSDEEWGS